MEKLWHTRPYKVWGAIIHGTGAGGSAFYTGIGTLEHLYWLIVLPRGKLCFKEIPLTNPPIQIEYGLCIHTFV